MQASAGIRSTARTVCAALLLVACTPVAPTVKPKPTVIAEPAKISGQSTELAAYYEQVQQTLLAQGLLRTDSGDDVQVGADTLTTNFMRIAFNEETSAQTPAPVALTRWDGPVRVGLTFGASVSPERQAADRAKIASYLARLGRLTGHEIGLSSTKPNFFITIANMDERRILGPSLKSALPELNASQIAGVTDLNRATYCLVWTQNDAASGEYERAFVFIPSEHPDLMRLACIHEEIAQGLGLPNDSGTNRPSIFNDDEEFALLTHQDEMMLRLLYDPALTPGMTEVQARPIVQTLANRLLGGNS